jgi:hypothetical protein
MIYRLRMVAILLMLSIALGACGTAAAPNGTEPAPVNTALSPASNPTNDANMGTPTQAATATPLAPSPKRMGPDLESFPPNYSPLSGQPVQDLSTLKLPAMLISISNFPATARPQAGLSFASYVFEFSITEGATRFLSVFYGDFPKTEIPFTGGCPVRMQPFAQTSQVILGDRVWLDANGNGLLDFGEPGLGGVCVNLYDAAGKQIDQTITDSNGYYGFNLAGGEDAPQGPYVIEVRQPAGMKFSAADAGDDEQDSDADPATGRMHPKAGSSQLDLDAGLIPQPGLIPTPDPTRKPIKEEVGPVRSGRLIYADFANMFQDSCLVYAFAYEEVLQQIPTCAMVVHEVSGGGDMLPIERMRAIAEDNRKADAKFNYASNLYTVEPPEGGLPGTELDVYFALLNQSGWKYDPLMHSYLRFADNSEKGTAGELHPDTDRLTGRQLHFENLVVLFTDHVVISPTNLDIDLAQGGLGPAYLFRDGHSYPIRWSTRSGEYEKKTGFRRPIQWINADGSPAALKPGHTWVIIVTPFSSFTDAGEGIWKLRFAPPEGSS